MMEILYEDNHLLAVNKLPGQIVQGDKTGDLPLVEMARSYIKKKYNKPGNVYCGLVHRIDRPVGGCVLFAKTSKALARMNQLVKDREVHKKYLAIVKNAPPDNEGSLEHFLWKDQKKNKSFVKKESFPAAKKAVLAYKVVSASKDYYLLEVELISGRHHQIRTQLSSIGCPIKGDLKYGFPRSNPDGSIDLLSYSMSFVHPVKKEEITIKAAFPESTLWEYFRDNNKGLF